MAIQNITLISSFHKEIGKCNPNELYKIIENICPDIIFEELPKDIFEGIYLYGYVPNSVEAKAIKKYLENYPIKHFPVDTYEFKDNDIFDGFDIISKQSVDYIKVLQQQISMIEQFGYTFLNSAQCTELIDNLHVIEENVLLGINDIQLSCKYTTSCKIHSEREETMLENIYKYSNQFNYSNAIFICGAEHRKSIIQKIEVYEKKSEIKLNWIFSI